MLQATIVYGMQLTVHELKRHFCLALWRHSFYARLVEFLSGVTVCGRPLFWYFGAWILWYLPCWGFTFNLGFVEFEANSRILATWEFDLGVSGHFFCPSELLIASKQPRSWVWVLMIYRYRNYDSFAALIFTL